MVSRRKAATAGTVEDWAAKAARHVLRDLGRSETHAPRVASILEMHAKPILDLLDKASPQHSDDCAQLLSMGDSVGDDELDDCDCDVSRWETRVRRATQGRRDL